MSDMYPPNVGKTIQALLTHSAVTSPEIRQSIFTRTIQLTEGVQPAEVIPDELISFVDKIIFEAYRITDEDVHLLKNSGYTEDQIFEITLCAALGAGVTRIEKGLSALRGI